MSGCEDLAGLVAEGVRAEAWAAALEAAADRVMRLDTGWCDGISAEYHRHTPEQMRMFAVMGVRSLTTDDASVALDRVRAEAWAAALEAAASRVAELLTARRRANADYNTGVGVAIDAIRAMITDDARAALDRIKAEARAEGMREAARIAADHTPEKHGGAPLAAHVTGKSIELAIFAAIPETQR